MHRNIFEITKIAFRSFIYFISYRLRNGKSRLLMLMFCIIDYTPRLPYINLDIHVV